MHEDFINFSIVRRNEYLIKTEELFLAEKNIWHADYVNHFQTICTEINRLQSGTALPAISYMEHTMLYTNFINRHYVAEFIVYNDKSYLDKNQHIVGEYDISYLFVYFEELWNRMLQERKRYLGMVTSREITELMIKMLPDFYSYLSNIARPAVTECIRKRPFIDIRKNKKLVVSVGDYMVCTEPVHTVHKKNYTNKQIEQLSELSWDKCIFEDYSGLDFFGHDLEFSDFRYSQFYRSCLDNVSFYGSELDGANFYEAHMDNCCMENCSIYEADFSFAFLRNANFVNARGQTGLPNNEEWLRTGFLPVSFRFADLSNADFTNADLRGADFTGAKFDGAIFTGAKFDGAIF